MKNKVKKKGVDFSTPKLSLYSITYYKFLLSFSKTSCAPPSTILVAETRVNLAFFCNSGILRAPQLHIVDLTLAKEAFTLSFNEPAYGT